MHHVYVVYCCRWLLPVLEWCVANSKYSSIGHNPFLFIAGDQYLKALDIRYIDRWRDFGIFLAYTAFNAFLAYVGAYIYMDITPFGLSFLTDRLATTCSEFARLRSCLLWSAEFAGQAKATNE
jgi:hypothetical protein